MTNGVNIIPWDNLFDFSKYSKTCIEIIKYKPVILEKDD